MKILEPGYFEEGKEKPKEVYLVEEVTGPRKRVRYYSDGSIETERIIQPKKGVRNATDTSSAKG